VWSRMICLFPLAQTHFGLLKGFELGLIHLSQRSIGPFHSHWSQFNWPIILASAGESCGQRVAMINDGRELPSAPVNRDERALSLARSLASRERERESGHILSRTLARRRRRRRHQVPVLPRAEVSRSRGSGRRMRLCLGRKRAEPLTGPRAPLSSRRLGHNGPTSATQLD